ncbi:hypothetical protein FHJ31_09210 [Pseudomonas sp. Fig-3]|nr:hypothetical protein FHJ31_09210 [Pseudomonas sp. Fig-3]
MALAQGSWAEQPLWRGSLLPLGGAAAPGFFNLGILLSHASVASAAQPSGSKLPRHKSNQCN